jgi:predicted alpha/beta hydrolase
MRSGPLDSEAVSRAPFSVACADGWILRGELMTPSEPRAVAVVSHAMMVDRRTVDWRNRGLASTLAARGIAVVLADLRGHGESAPRAGERDWGYDDIVENDVPALLQLAREKFPSLPCVTVGHSLFGHVSLAHVARHPEAPVDGLVLLACNVSHPSWTPLSRLAKGPLIEVMWLSTRLFGRLPVRRFGIGSDDEAPRYVADMRRGWRTNSWHARDGFDYFAALPSVKQPLLALVGARDRLYSPPADARSLVAPVPRHELAVVGRASGLAFDPDHMAVVLDARARPVWERIADFVLSVRARSRPTTPALPP